MREKHLNQRALNIQVTSKQMQSHKCEWHAYSCQSLGVREDEASAPTSTCIDPPGKNPNNCSLMGSTIPILVARVKNGLKTQGNNRPREKL